MNFRFDILFLSAAFTVLSCSPEQKQPSIHTYFDLQAFTKGQITQLDSLRPTVEKRVMSGDKEETKRISSINWEKELDLFIQADLNKPAYIKSYVVETPTENTTIYRALPGEDVPVKYMKIDVDQGSRKLVKLEADITSENYLYASRKRLTMECGPNKNGQWIVQNYVVTGFQQLAFFESKPFLVMSRIL